MNEILQVFNEKMPGRFHHAKKLWKLRMLAAGMDHNNVFHLLESANSWDQWLPACLNAADEFMKKADQALKDGNYATAGYFYKNAALSYHFGQFMWFCDEKAKKETYQKCAEAFKKAAPLMNPAAHRIEVPWNREIIPGYVRIPPNVKKPPVLFMVNGIGAWKEELMSFTDFFLDRGIATVSFDGPSQGELEHVKLTRTNYEEAVSALIDWIIRHYPELDTDNIALTGISLGGYTSVRCAAADGRIKAVCGIGGLYDLSDLEGKTPLFKQVEFSKALGFQDWKSFYQHANEVVNLSDVIENIQCSMLMIHGENDPIADNQHSVRIIEKAINSPDKELKIFEGGNHVCTNQVCACRSYAADWVAKRLSA